MSSRNKKAPTTSQQFVFGFIGIVSFVAIFLGLIHVSQSIRHPVNEARERRQTFFQNQVSGYSEDDLLRRQDTDQDGLSDYEELNFYSTSPYLPDSDSDGFDDKQEVDAGYDPNCPSDKNCRSASVGSNADSLGSTPVDTSQLSDFVNPDAFLSEDLLSDVSQSGQDVYNLTIPELKDILLETGQITQEQLDQIDDDALLKIYQEVLNSS